MAQEIEGITVKFGADTVEFDKSVNGINKALKLVKNDFKAINNDLKFDSKNPELYKKKLENLEQQLKLVKERNSQFSASLQELGKRTDSNADLFDKLTRKIQDGNLEASKLERSIASLNSRMEQLPYARFEAMGKSLQKVGTNLQTVGKALAPLSLLGGGILAKASQEAIQFEDAFAGVAKTVDATDEQLEKISEGIREMSTRLPSTTDEISAVAESAGQLGIKTDDILDFTETMIGLGSATNLTADEASTMIAQFANVTGMEGDYDRLGSALVQLGNNGASTEKDIMELAQRLSGAGATAGLTEQEILALGASMANVGINAEAGGTSMSTWISQISMAVAEGGESLEGFLEVAQMTEQEFTDTWSSDPTKVLQALLDGLNQIEKDGGSSLLALSKVGVEGTRMRDTILRLANSEGEIAKNVEMANNAWEENIALQTEVDKKNSTLANQLKITKQLFDDIALEIGNTLTPTISKFTETVRAVYERFKELSPQQKEMVTKFVAISTAVSPLLIGIGKLSSLLGGLTINMEPLAKHLNGFSLKFPLLNALIAKFSSIFAKLGLLIAPFTAKIGAMFAKLAPFGELFTALASKISALGGVVGKFLTSVMPLGAWIAGIVVAVGYAIATNEKVRESLVSIWNQIQMFMIPIFNTLTTVVNTVLKPAFDAIITVLDWLSINVIQPLFAFIANNLMPIFVQLANHFSKVLIPIVRSLGGVVETVIGFFDGLFTITGKLWSAFMQTEWVQALIVFFQDLWGVVENLIDTFGRLCDAISNAWNMATNFLSDVGKGIGDFFGGLFSSGGLGINAELMASGGLGIRNLTINAPINVNNQGREIGASEVNGWIEQIADGVSIVLGRRLV